MRGEKREAYQFALSEKMWAHAMIIASSIDKDAWKEVVNEFIKAEMGPKDAAVPSAAQSSRGKESLASVFSGRESLRVAYSLFAGQGAASGLLSCQYLYVVYYLFY